MPGPPVAGDRDWCCVAVTTLVRRSAGSSQPTLTRNNMTTRCARGPLPARCGPACAGTCGSTGRRCAAPPAAAAPRCCCPGSGTAAPPPPSSPSTSRKTNEIPVFRGPLDKIPAAGIKDAVITADQMHTQRKHARKIRAAGAHFVFTIGENQKKLFDAADALPWGSIAGEAWTADRGPRPRPRRCAHHQDPAAHRTDQGTVPARGAGVPRRAVQLRAGRGTARRGRRPRHHQPVPGPGRPG